MKDNEKVNVFLNFQKYNLPLPECFLVDSVKTNFNVKNFFDAIICDPPYNKRAGIGNHKINKEDAKELTKG